MLWMGKRDKLAELLSHGLVKKLLRWKLATHPNPILFITYFIYGFVLFTDPRYEKAIDRYKLIALILGPVLYLIVPYFNLNG